MHKQGFELRVLTQNIDTAISEGRLFLHMIVAFDEAECELIVENTRAGLASPARAGRKGGRPRRRMQCPVRERRDQPSQDKPTCVLSLLLHGADKEIRNE